MKRRNQGITKLKSRYGLLFVAPWLIGFILFFAMPAMQSILYSFSDVQLTGEGLQISLVGLKHYRYALLENPKYVTNMWSSVGTILYSLPFILLISLVLALILNQKFRGRLFFRALFFLPVIISTGIVLNLMFLTTGSDMTGASASESLTGNMFSVADVISVLNLPSVISDYVEQVINSIFDLIWSSGIQIVLFIAGLQAIPASLYEASRVEGATKWEEFWFITFPMLSQVTLLVALFTMVEQLTSSRNALVSQLFQLMKAGLYDETSAVLWAYFVIVGAVMGLVLGLYNRILIKRWS
ncbi:MAG: carbohydrate ABC transporter permease [Acutalibacteraceae bacterium]